MATFSAETGDIRQSVAEIRGAADGVTFNVSAKKPNTTSKPWKEFDEQTDKIGEALSQYLTGLDQDMKNVLSTAQFIDDKDQAMSQMIESNTN
ncbi:TIGR04197 family type VII secretion effector [Weissella confusa]|uniref:TIGR04197 family type VII secretion effector n=1 Tax=Weissella confusa TaxID=1583 RepID=UPI001C6FAF3E|nr:TIGR04197 family type VII secretion effector [Weissella confusa]QYU58616.1 TIGR04197 family type VII secretion effector [Weissella confusa]